MKKLLLLFILMPLLSFNTIQTDKLVGKWKGVDEKDKIGFMTFDTEGFVSIEVDGEILGGKESDMNGEKVSMTYSINLDTDPVEIDFTMTKLSTKEQRSMLFIAEFQDEDNIKLASNFNAERPTEFNIDNSIVLTRMK